MSHARVPPFTLVLTIALSLLTTSVLAGQAKAPKRPKLPVGADTNSAQAYYDLGVGRLAKQPKEAADAFWWASRLAPNWAEPLYAQRIALLLSKPDRLVRYYDGDKSVIRSPEMRQIDSLEFRALLHNPFLHRDLEREVISTYMSETWMKSMRSRYSAAEIDAARPELEYWINSYLNSARGGSWRAWRAYTDGQFADAVKQYAQLLKDAQRTNDSDELSYLYTQRGRLFYLMSVYDSARVQLVNAIEHARATDTANLVVLYRSKAIPEYSLGMVFEEQRDFASARDAYARALMEDLAFYPAHQRLATIALTAGDTTTALNEFELAAQIDPNAAIPQAFLGHVRYMTGDLEQAIPALQRVLELEPYFAEGYLMMALAQEKAGKQDEAAANFETFLARSQAHDQRRAAVTQRVAELRRPS